jgi:hypothetical protein
MIIIITIRRVLSRASSPVFCILAVVLNCNYCQSHSSRITFFFFWQGFVSQGCVAARRADSCCRLFMVSHVYNFNIYLGARERQGPFLRPEKLRTATSSLSCDYLGSHARTARKNAVNVSNLYLRATLKEHSGCVNTINWNDAGNLIITGSDDCKVVCFILEKKN